MLERVRDVLADCGAELSAEELLDALWLATRLPSAAASAGPLPGAAGPASTGEPPHGPEPRDPGPDRTGPSGEPPEAPGPSEPSDAPPGGSGALHAAPVPVARRERSAAEVPAMPVRAPGEKALGGAELRLGRALRPLRHRRPDALRWELDVPATVAVMAETGLPDAVVRPAVTRWLDLVMLVDDGVSMLLWQRLAAEVRVLMERSGAFRDIRVFGLDSRSPGGPRLRHRPFGDGPATLSLSTVGDPSGNTLLLVVSDGVGAAWRDGRMHAALERAAATGPAAVLQVLPPRLWGGSGIRAERWKVTTRRRGAAGGSWQVADPVLPPELAPFDGIPVPVLEATPASVGAWAALIGSPGGSAVLPLLARPGTDAGATPPGADGTPVRAGGEGTPEAVLRFREAASPEAYRLAAHLAAVAPLPVPVMRLVQGAMSPAVDTSHLAEVFLGGLMHRDERGARGLPHHREFDFREDTRRILLGTVPPAELVRTTRAVTARLARLAGASPDFPAWLPHPEGPERVAVDGPRPFGWVDERVMRRLGVAAPAPAAGRTAAVPAPPAPPTAGPEGPWDRPDVPLRLTGSDWAPVRPGDPRFTGAHELPYTVFAEHRRGWTGLGLFLALDGDGTPVVIRRIEGPALRGTDLVAREVVALNRMAGVHAPRLLAHDAGAVQPWVAVECARDDEEEPGPAPGLRRFVSRYGPLHEDGLLAIARQFANGLVRAHRKGLVHGSLVPGNVLIAGHEVRITGWLTATVADRPSRHRKVFAREQPYQAPELADPAVAPTPASDVYAMGAILLAAASGEWADARREGGREAEPIAGARLAEALLDCVDPAPERRPTAEEVLHTLNDIAHRRGSQRHRLRVVLGRGATGRPVRVDLAGPESGGSGPHMLCQGALDVGRREFLDTVLRQLTGRNPADGLRLLLADFTGRSGLERYADRAMSGAALGLSGVPSRALDLRERLVAELGLREGALASAECPDIAAYEARRSAEPGVPALPRLVVAVDEVTEILPRQPELSSVLLRVARTGGRLGIHLLLATRNEVHPWFARSFLEYIPTRVTLRTRRVGLPAPHDVPDGGRLAHASWPEEVWFEPAPGDARETLGTVEG
ncbi:SAV_2336 N-terminal domain-related protein [Streptomyces sp. NPDC045431]|uniref:SAV_2336 N-terminal domain-related protein n=1 Tax=Streptomyces sp. NPDC045431 TaxID=3155613 RepID=UPI0033C3274C